MSQDIIGMTIARAALTRRTAQAALTRRGLLGVVAGGTAASVLLSRRAAAQTELKVGFIVKMPEQAWFQNEQSAADALGRQMHFDVVNIGGQDGEKCLSAIDNLAAQGAKGFVICPPDVRLGPAIVARAKAHNMKLVTVDDRFTGPDGKPLAAVPHLGLSSFKIGQQVGQTIWGEMQRRGWRPEEVGAVRITDYELPTAKERTDGATKALLDAGFANANIFDAPQRTTDTEGGSNAASPVFARHGNFKKWVMFALNEETVLGGVRASEQFKIAPEAMIGVGINGSAPAFAEFSKSQPSGFFATVAVSSTLHGRQSTLNLVDWIRDGKQPPLVTETTGTVMTRQNWQQVKQTLGI